MSRAKIFLEVNGRKMSLAELMKNPSAATVVRVDNCPGLAVLPELPAATVVRVDNCPGLAAKDSRGYSFAIAKIRGQWRIIAGCQNFSFEDARRHWGRDGASDRPDCLALVEKLITSVGALA